MFTGAAKGVDRTLATREENAALDSKLDTLLRHLIPFLQMPAAHKIFEWLVWRFRVHEFNIPAVVDMALPYHETKLFGRIIRLLDLSHDRARFYWLEAVNNTAVPLTRTALVHRATKDTMVLKLIAELYGRCHEGASPIHTSRPVTTLFFSVVSGVLAQTPLDNDTVSALLPYLLAGLKNEQDHELCTAALGLVAQLAATSTQLANAPAAALLHRVCALVRVFSSPTLVLGCLALLCHQDALQGQALPTLAADCLRSHAALPEQLAEAAAGNSASFACLYHALFRSLIGNDPHSLRLGILEQVPLDNGTVELLVGLLIDQFRQDGDGTTLQPLLTRLERRYPTELDRLLAARVPQPTPGDDWPQRLLALFCSPLRQQFVPGSETSLLLSLQHPLVNVRMAAVETLRLTLQQQSSVEMEPLLAEMLTDRLQDSDDSVVGRVLDLGPSLVQNVPADRLFTVLEGRLYPQPGLAVPPAKNKTVKKIVQLLASDFGQAHPAYRPRITTLLLGHILFTPKSLKIVPATLQAIAASGAQDGYPLFAGLKTLLQSPAWGEATEAQDSTRLNQLLIANMALAATQAAEALANAATRAGLARHVAILIWLQHVATAETPMVGVIDCIVNACSSELAGPGHRLEQTAAGVDAPLLQALQEWVDRHAGYSMLPPSSALMCHYLLALCQVLPSVLAMAAAPVLFAALAQVRKPRHYAPALQMLFQRCAPEPLCFLHRTLMQPGNAAPVATRALLLVASVLRAGTSAGSLDCWTQLFPVLCVLAADPRLSVRRAALHALGLLVSAGTAPHESLSSLGTHICEAAGTIAADPSAVARVCATYLSTAPPTATRDLITAAVAGTHPAFQARLLAMVHAVNTSVKLETIHPLLVELLERTRKHGFAVLSADEQSVLFYCLTAMSPETGPLFKPAATGDNPYFSSLCLALELTDAAVSSDHTPQAWALRHVLGPKLFETFSAGQMTTIFAHLCMLLHRHGGGPVADLMSQTLARLPIKAATFVQQLSQCMQAPPADGAAVGEPASKRRRTPKKAVGGRATGEEKAVALQQTSTLLEVLYMKAAEGSGQARKTAIQQMDRLIVPLFELLTACLALDATLQAQVQHVQLLVLECLTAICAASKAKFLQEEHMNTELIVECVRSSNSPQIHSTALLLLARIATLFPARVLDSIMPMFTFMSASTMRQDDNYNFVVLERTITAVIPALLATSKDERSLPTVVGAVLGIFVDALEHIPAHRRLRVFSTLVETVGSSAYLHTIIGLVQKKVVLIRLKEQEIKDLQTFCLQMATPLPIMVQMRVVEQLLTLVMQLATDAALEPAALAIVNPETVTPKQLRHLQFCLLSYVASHLTARAFLQAVMVFEKTHETDDLRRLYHGTLEVVLAFSGLARGKMHATEGGRKGGFWHQMNLKAYDILDSVVGLMSVADFVNVTAGLLQHADPSTVRKAILLVTERVKDFDISSQSQQAELFVQLLLPLQTLLTQATEAAVLQTAVFALTMLANKLARLHPAIFVTLLEPILELLSQHPEQLELRGSIFVAIASLCAELGVRVLLGLQRFMPAFLDALVGLLDHLVGGASLSDGQKVLLPSVVAALYTLVRGIPQFLGPYVRVLSRCVVHPTLQDPVVVGAEISSKVAAISKLLPEVVPARVLLPAVYQAYGDLTASPPDAAAHASIARLVSMMSVALAKVPAKEFANLQVRAVAFFLSSFELRNQCAPDDAHVTTAEDAIIDGFVTVVLRMSESTFKPVFLKMLDWISTANATASPVRLLVLFKTVTAILQTLKSLFVPYFGHLLKLSVSLLQKGSELVAECPHLCGPVQGAVLASLTLCFSFDTVGFVTKERFDALRVPLVDMLDEQAGESRTSYLIRVRQQVVPCLGQLAQAVNSRPLWTVLNRDVLFKARSPAARTRQAAIMVIREFYEQLGDEFLPLLPETVPALAELLEGTFYNPSRQSSVCHFL